MQLAKQKPGYKQTEVGVIPADWDAKPLEAGVSLFSGYHVLAGFCNTQGEGTPYLTGPADFPNGKIEHTKFTTRPGTICEKNDILVTVKGSGSGTLVLADAPYCISRQLMAVRVREWNRRFVFEQLGKNSSVFGAAATGLIPGLSRSDILNTVIPLPPTLGEQEAIAAALSDADGLIESLEKLIAKKRQIKHGTMQELLTGKRRLPGFNGKWERRRFGDICVKIQDGTHFSPKTGGNDYLYVTSKNIGFGTMDITTAERITKEEHIKIYSRCDVCKGDLLLTKDGANTGNAALNTLDEPFSLLSSVALLRFDKRNYEARFFLYQILSPVGQLQIKELMSGNAITRLTLQKIRSLRCFVTTIAEQAAIADILSDMDAEITVLDAKLAKARQVKQGMMQKLLTGRIRLV